MSNDRAEILATDYPNTSAARIVIAAPASRIFDVLANPASHRLFDGSETIQSSISGPERLFLGAQFSMAMNNLLSHENDIYNISNNNCTTIALNAFNLLITPKITIEPFVVQMPTNPPQAPYFFMQSPQKLYKAIDSFQPGTGLSKEFNVNNDSPLSTNICP